MPLSATHALLSHVTRASLSLAFSMGTSCSTTLEQAQRTLIAKHFNVMDPLLPHNNLGRSVSQSNLARIRAAFAHGAAKLRKALCCAEPTRAVAEVGSLPLQ